MDTVLARDGSADRWYQVEAVNGVFHWFYEGNGGNPLVVCPTGAGKSRIMGRFCRMVLDRWPDQEILILTHVGKLVEQDAEAVRKYLPDSAVGVFSAGLGLKQRRRITVASIQTAANSPHYFRGITIVLVDECHRIPHKAVGQYRKFLDLFTCPVVGLTATHFRLGTGYLHEGDERLFTGVCYEVDLLTLVDQGYLSDMIAREPTIEMNTNGVRKAGGDFVVRALAEQLDREELTAQICDDLVQYKERYRKWLLFAIDVKHAEHVQHALLERGIVAAVVHSKQSKGANDTSIAKFEEGSAQALVSIETLTTGYDCPSVDLVGLLRPTASPVLHIQMLGRGSRVVYADGHILDTPEQRLAAIAAGPKPHCIVRDYAGNIKRLGPINAVQVQAKKKKGAGEAITKVCPDCGLMVAGSVRICPSCKHEFVFKQKLKTKAGKDEVITRRKQAEPPKKHRVTLHVDAVAYGLYVGRSGKQTLHVVYTCGYQTYTEYKLFDAASTAWFISKRWWNDRTLDKRRGVPKTSQEAHKRAMSGELLPPREITVELGGKYPDIVNYKVR